MTVSGDRLRVADRTRTVTPRHDPPRPAPLLPPAGVDDLPRYLRAAAVRADADDLSTAYAACDTAIAAATRWRSPAALAGAHALRTSVYRRLGDMPAAERDGEVAAELFAAAGADPRGDAVLVLLARRIATRHDRGDLAGAEKLLAEVEGEPGDGSGALALRYARGRLYADTGRPGEGLADLFHCGERLAARQADRPHVLPWRSAAAQVLAATGTREAAARLVAAEVAAARRSGPASALGRALRVEGMVLDGPAGLAALDEAVRVLRESPRRFEYALALVDFGAALTAARRRPQARRVLREAADLAEACGSTALKERAQRGYVAAGGKIRPVVPAPRSGA
jgi:tetratricopeptide (TPR) repeat protein